MLIRLHKKGFLFFLLMDFLFIENFCVDSPPLASSLTCFDLQTWIFVSHNWMLLLVVEIVRQFVFDLIVTGSVLCMICYILNIGHKNRAWKVLCQHWSDADVSVLLTMWCFTWQASKTWIHACNIHLPFVHKTPVMLSCSTIKWTMGKQKSFWQSLQWFLCVFFYFLL